MIVDISIWHVEFDTENKFYQLFATMASSRDTYLLIKSNLGTSAWDGMEIWYIYVYVHGMATPQDRLDRAEGGRVDQLAQDLVSHAAGRGHVVGGGPEIRRLAVVAGKLGRVLW